MSKNYIKVFLESFRESKVFGSLLKFVGPVASDSSEGNKKGRNEVGIYFGVISL